MTPRQIREYRYAETFMPALWRFAYPFRGRGLAVMRWWAFRLWCKAFGLAIELRDR